jgi:hypothetical protein
MKKDTKQTTQELELEQRKLNNLSIAANMRAQESRLSCEKIEQARRNVEVITKVYNSFADDKGREIQGKMKDALLPNLEILKETSKL